jgi:small subunit ribosomal protein S13
LNLEILNLCNLKWAKNKDLCKMKNLKNFELFKNINKKKNIFSSLKTIHGLNNKSINKILLLNGMGKFESTITLNPGNFDELKKQAEFFYNLEENKIFNSIAKKKKIKNYSGMRHLLRLPVRGQRTHTNGKTPKKYIKKEI